jgi:hypothetical protein
MRASLFGRGQGRDSIQEAVPEDMEKDPARCGRMIGDRPLYVTVAVRFAGRTRSFAKCGIRRS